MTQQQKKMWQIIGGGVVALLLAVIGVIYAAGGQSKQIQFNTERIKRVEYKVDGLHDKMENGFERIYNKIDNIKR